MKRGVDHMRVRPGHAVRDPRVVPMPRRPGPHEPRPRRNPLTPLGWVSVALTLVLVAVTLGAYAYYRRIESGIDREVINVDATRPPETGALNVLLVGSDSREGDNKKYGPRSQGEG